MSTQSQNVIDEHERGGEETRRVAPTQDDVVTFIHENPVREIFYDARVAGALALGVALGAALVLITLTVAKVLG